MVWIEILIVPITEKQPHNPALLLKACEALNLIILMLPLLKLQFYTLKKYNPTVVRELRVLLLISSVMANFMV